uniref:Transposase (Putative), gypsy type n=1 Tax=Tanacetum cinerariifolium TaxID=118510 RepID=A0A6L2KBR3_TANCI|nr:hypothetical protein [Tanacetum cinerariifolium]
MGRDTVQIETVVSTISQEYLLEFTSEYGISKDPHPELPGPEERIMDFLEGKVEDEGQGTVAPEVPPPENIATTGVAQEAGLAMESAAMGPRVIKMRRKRGNDGSTIGGKSLAAMEIGMGSTFPTPTSRDMPVDVSDPDPLSFADPQSNIPRMLPNLPRERPLLEIQNRSIPPLPPWSGHPKAFISRSGDQRIQARENEIKNLESLLEAETGMKKTAKAKNAEFGKELESLRALFLDLQVSNDPLEEFKQYEDNRVEERCAEMDARLDALSIDFDEELYPHMLTAIAGRIWVIRHGLRLAVIKCGESTKLRQVFTDVVSAGIVKGMSEGLKYEVEHGKANLSLEAIEAYDPEVETKYVAALHALKDLKYPMVDQLESLKNAPIDVIMASLHLESDTGDDAPQWIRKLRHSCSQLKIPVITKVRDPNDPWACKEEILLADGIAANISYAKKKKKCRVVCRTHGVGSAHHARSDGVLVSVSTVVLQGLAILLTDAATQTEASEDGASPRLLESSSLPAMYNLD